MEKATVNLTVASTTASPCYVSLLLPYPTSVNDLWGYGKGRVFKTKAYVAWQKEAYVAWLQQKRQQPIQHIGGRYRLCIYASPPDTRRRRDIGNLEKAVSDLLVSVGVVDDDHLAKSVFTEWDAGFLDAGYIRVEVTPYKA